MHCKTLLLCGPLDVLGPHLKPFCNFQVDHLWSDTIDQAVPGLVAKNLALESGKFSLLFGGSSQQKLVRLGRSPGHPVIGGVLSLEKHPGALNNMAVFIVPNYTTF